MAYRILPNTRYFIFDDTFENQKYKKIYTFVEYLDDKNKLQIIADKIKSSIIDDFDIFNFNEHFILFITKDKQKINKVKKLFS